MSFTDMNPNVLTCDVYFYRREMIITHEVFVKDWWLPRRNQAKNVLEIASGRKVRIVLCQRAQ